MVMDAVVERCVEQSPVTVMARLALQRALEPAWIDELFERAGGTQYTRELLFSTTVELMSVVAVGLRPSSACGRQGLQGLAGLGAGPVRQDPAYGPLAGTGAGAGKRGAPA